MRNPSSGAAARTTAGGGASTKLREYRRKRDFGVTPEPSGTAAARAPGDSFVIQKHAATRLHYDFRLELDGVLLSWAVPRGPSLDPGDKRLAMRTEDHPIDYGSFEGVIPEGEYGGGTVLLWDRGTWEPVGDARKGLTKGKLEFVLHGEKLGGRWTLVKIRGRQSRDADKAWLLIKGRDDAARSSADYDVTAALPDSVATERGMDEIAHERDRVWHSNKPAKSGGRRGATRTAAPRVDAGSIREHAAQRAGLVAPQLATLVAAPPPGDEWMHEMKFDGYRVLCRIDGGTVKLFSRNGKDWTARLPGVARAAAQLGTKSALLDGEVAVLLPSGVTSFNALQNALGGESSAEPPTVSTCSTSTATTSPAARWRRRRGAAWSARSRQRARRCATATTSPATARHFCVTRAACRSKGWSRSGATRPTNRGGSHLAQGEVHPGAGVRRRGLHGAGGKRSGIGASPRRARRRRGRSSTPARSAPASAARTRRTFAVVSTRSRRRRVRSRSGPRARRTRTGRGRSWSARSSSRSGRPTAGCAIPRGRVCARTSQHARSCVSVRPARRARARVGMGGGGCEALVRASPDRADAEGDRGRCRRGGGVRITHPDRVVYPPQGITKLDLARFYESIADWILPHLRGRPTSLVRCPEGLGEECFYQKHVGVWAPAALRRVRIREKKKVGEYLVVEDLPGLIGLVQIGILEIHTWNAVVGIWTNPTWSSTRSWRRAVARRRRGRAHRPTHLGTSA
jgi:bifunctional non-homologous end joining protein LigD